MADEYRIALVGYINEPATKAMIDKSLNKISTSIKGVDMSNVKNIDKTFKTTADGAKVLEKSTSSMSDGMGKASKTTLDANNKIKNMNQNLKSATKSTVTFGQSITSAASKMLYWTLIGGLIFGVKHQLESLVEEVIKLDDAILELNKTSDLTADGLEKFADKARSIGQEIDESAASVVNASADFTRMGFTAEEALDLAEQAIMLTKIADDIDSVDESTKALISTLKGFGMESSETANIVDMLNEVSNSYSVTTGDLADGLRRTGAIMAQSGTTIQETIGMFTAIQEVMNNAEKSSASMITISTRLRRVNEDMEVAEGLVMNLEEAFNRYADMSLVNADGSLRSTYDVLTELATKWEELEDFEQEYLKFLVSGSRQSPPFIALMNNLSTATGATATAMDSAGSAMVEFNKVQDSLSGTLDSISASLSNIKNNLLGSEFVGGVLDSVDAILDLSTAFFQLADGITESETALMKFLRDRAFNGLLPILARNGDELSVIADEFIKVANGTQLFYEANQNLFEIFTSDNGAAIAKTREELEKLQEAGAGSKILYDAMENYKQALMESSDVSVEEIQRIERAQIVLKANMLDEEFDRQRASIFGFSKAVSETTDEIIKLSDVFVDYINNGKLSDEMISKLVGNQENLDYALSLTEDQLLKLGASWGLTAKDVQSIHEQWTKSTIEEVRKQMAAIRIAKESLRSMFKEFSSFSSIDITNDPILGKNSAAIEAQERINAMASNRAREVAITMAKNAKEFKKLEDELSTLGERSDWDFGLGKSDSGIDETTKELKEYDSTMDDLNRKIHSYNLLVEQQATYDLDNYVEQIESAKDVIEEIEELLELGYQDWSKMSLGTEEYRQQEESLRKLEIDRYEWMQKIKAIHVEMTAELEDQADILEKISNQYEDSIVGGINDAIDAIKKQKDEVSDYYDKLIDGKEKEIDAQKLKDELEERELERKKKLQEIEEARERLRNIQNQRTYKQLQEDGTFEYVANPKDVKEAQDEISRLQSEFDAWRLQNKKTDYIRSLEAEKQAYEESKSLALSDLDAKIEIQNNMMDSLKSIEADSYKERIALLQKFVAEYNAKMSEIGGTSLSISDPKSIRVSTGSGKKKRETTLIDEMRKNSEAWHTAPDDVKPLYEKANEELAPNGWTKKSGSWYNEDGIKAYGTGGYVDKPHTAIVGDVPEHIIPKSLMSDYLATATMKISSMMPNSSSFSGLNGQSSSSSPINFYGDIQVRANNANEFETSIRQLIQTGVNV